MIIKIRFRSSDKKNREFNMLFGNSYKNWKEQFCEYRGLFKNEIPIKVWRSKSKWKGWGGLKWCLESEFQEELNREDTQDGEPDNPKPRQYSKMKFWEFDLKDLSKIYPY